MTIQATGRKKTMSAHSVGLASLVLASLAVGCTLDSEGTNSDTVAGGVSAHAGVSSGNSGGKLSTAVSDSGNAGFAGRVLPMGGGGFAGRTILSSSLAGAGAIGGSGAAGGAAPAGGAANAGSPPSLGGATNGGTTI